MPCHSTQRGESGSGWGGGGSPRDALEGKGPQRGAQRRLGRRLEEAAKAVGGGCCRCQMPLKLALAAGGQWGHRLGALEGGGGWCASPPCHAGGNPPPSHPWGGQPPPKRYPSLVETSIDVVSHETALWELHPSKE